MSKSLKDNIKNGVLWRPTPLSARLDVYGQVMENTWDKLELQLQQIVDQIINENQKNN
jgi:hypothetical protein